MKISTEELLVLYDIALSLNNLSSVDESIEFFIKKMSKKLNLRSVAIELEDDRVKRYRLSRKIVSYPKRHNYGEVIKNLETNNFVEFKKGVNFCFFSTEEEDISKYYYFFEVKGLGLISLERLFEPLGDYIPRLLVPTFEKLIENLESFIQKRELEEAKNLAEKMSAVKSNFLAVMSHEIRTPLNGILGYTELMSLSEMDKEQDDYIKKIYFSANTLLGIINDILDFTKLEDDHVELEQINFNLKNTVEDIVDLVESSYRFNENKFEIEYEKGMPRIFCSDKIRISQVLFNLVSNAFKFTTNGLIKISIKLSSSKEVLIEVSDSGIGIAKEKQGDLFKPFNQLDISTTRKYGGTGLGLAICKKITTLLKGNISVISSKGEGTCFKLLLPLEKELNLQKETLLGQAENLKPKGKLKNIMIVEDNNINLEMLRRILDKIGYQAVLARDGKEAYEIAKKNDLDLIFMDMRMPIMDGPSSTKKILSLKNKRTVPKIVALTANTSNEDRKKCFDAGMIDYIAKPFKIGDIKNVISKYLKD